MLTLDLARRLQGAFPHARLVQAEGGRIFLPLDDPATVAAAIHADTPAATWE